MSHCFVPCMPTCGQRGCFSSEELCWGEEWRGWSWIPIRGIQGTCSDAQHCSCPCSRSSEPLWCAQKHSCQLRGDRSPAASFPSRHHHCFAGQHMWVKTPAWVCGGVSAGWGGVFERGLCRAGPPQQGYGSTNGEAELLPLHMPCGNLVGAQELPRGRGWWGASRSQYGGCQQLHSPPAAPLLHHRAAFTPKAKSFILSWLRRGRPPRRGITAWATWQPPLLPPAAKLVPRAGTGKGRG